jgi:hypothetical protein
MGILMSSRAFFKFVPFHWRILENPGISHVIGKHAVKPHLGHACACSPSSHERVSWFPKKKTVQHRMSMSRANSWVPGWAGLAHENNIHIHPLQRMEIGRLGQVPPNCLPYKDVLVARCNSMERKARCKCHFPSSQLHLATAYTRRGHRRSSGSAPKEGSGADGNFPFLMRRVRVRCPLRLSLTSIKTLLSCSPFNSFLILRIPHDRLFLWLLL